MRVIVLCAGTGDRWANFQNVPKHLVELCGEPLLARTVRLIGEHAPDADVTVVVADIRDRRYLEAVKAGANPKAKRTAHTPDPDLGDLDKIAAAYQLADPKHDTIVLMGDVWWSTPAIRTILTATPADVMRTFMRVGPNGAGGEIFAFTWPAAALDNVGAAIDRAIAAHHTGALATAGYAGQPVRGGWAFYRAWHHAPWNRTGVLDPASTVLIADWTDDMDTPHDWDEWCYRWATATDTERAGQV